MNIEDYQYTPGIIILYHFLRCRKNISDASFQEILSSKGYKELLQLLDIKQVTQLAIEAIETYFLKTCTIDYSHFFEEYDTENIDHFMDAGFHFAENYNSDHELIKAQADTIRYFHDCYIYNHSDLSFPYVNTKVPYSKLTKEEQDNELFILAPIFSSLDIYGIGEVDYCNGSFDLNQNIRSSLEANQNSKLNQNKIFSPSFESYVEDYDINEAKAKELGLVYTIKNRTIVINDYIGENDTLIIPKSIDKMLVKGIDGIQSKKIKKLIVLADLFSISPFSFARCDSLESVDVEGSLGLVGIGVFGSCSLKKSVVNGVTYLCINHNPYYLAIKYENYAFGNVMLNENCVSIMERAFCATNVRHVDMANVVYVGAYAFGQCSDLASVRLNPYTLAIGDYAFYQCTSLRRIKVNTKIIPEYMFYGCTNLVEVNLGDNVEIMQAYAFFDCNSLDRLFLPKSVHTLESLVFEYASITKLYFEEAYFWNGRNEDNCSASFSPEDLYDPFEAARAFKKHDDYDFRVNMRYKDMYRMTRSEAEEYGLSILENEDGTICVCSFSKDDEEELIIPKYIDNKKVVEIGGFLAFGFLSSLKRLVILADIVSIAAGSFSFCENLKEIIVPYSLEEIGSSFGESTHLLTKCDGVCYLKLHNNPYYCALSTYDDRDHIVIHSQTKILANSLFNGSNVRTINLPDIKTLPYRLFYEAKELESIYIPSSVTKIEDEVFYGCENLVECIMDGCDIHVVPKSMFENCTSLMQLILPFSVERIMGNAFCNCSSLEMISIPDAIERIEKGAFKGCTSLAAMDLSDSKWVYKGLFGPIYFTDYYETHPSWAAADIVSKHRGVCEKYHGDDEEFEVLQEQTKKKNNTLRALYYQSIEK